MILYTINGNYPDKNFNFTMNADAIGICRKVHSHGISSVNGLKNALDQKANADHKHIAMPELKIGGTASSITGEIELYGGNNMQITADGNTVTLAHVPADGVPVTGIRNVNPARRHHMLCFATGRKQFADDNAEYITFTENTNAESLN